MSLGYSIQVTHDGASGRVQKLAGNLAPQRIKAAIGPGVRNLFGKNYRSLGTNKRGWPSTGFWADADRATDWREVPEGVLISTNKIGVRQRFYGGTIKPVNARALTIPISPVSYGHRAKDFPGLFLLKTKRGAYLVQYGLTQAGQSEKATSKRKRIRSLGGNSSKRHEATLNFLFKLAASVEQKPDPDVVPENSEIGAVVKRAILAAGREPGK